MDKTNQIWEKCYNSNKNKDKQREDSLRVKIKTKIYLEIINNKIKTNKINN